MLGVAGVGDRGCYAILARNFSVKKLGKKEKGAKKEKEGSGKNKKRETVSKQPSSTAEIR